MIGDQGVRLSAGDDQFHTPASPDPSWSETTWFSFMIPERRLYVYVYPWIRPNQRLYGGGVMAWDEKSLVPWDAAVWDYEWNLPLGELGDLRDFTFPTGIRVQCLEPLTRYHVTYARPGCSLDVVFEALMEPHVIAHGNTMGLFSAHIDQPGHVTGQFTLGDETMMVDCYSIRDRSWGPRRSDPSFRLGYSCAQTATDAFLAFTYPDPSAAPMTFGYHWTDGQAAVLVSASRSIERRGPWPSRVIIEARDALGRDVLAVGESVNRISYTNVPWMFVWCSLMRWEVNGMEAWGEDQDAWHVESYRRFARSLVT